LNIPTLDLFEFLCSFARSTPTIGLYNPLRTNDWALAMSSRIMRAKSLDKDLDKQALAAVSTWKFEPATKDGKPVAVHLKAEVDFRLY